jgi:hypothetical protein
MLGIMRLTGRRFAVANVDDGVIRQLGPRLKRMNDMMGMTEEQSDV